jgi:hypothetical protein
MRKNLFIVSLAALFLLGAFQPVFAGLIDYDRRNRRSATAGEDAPEWWKTEPDVKNKLERRYDTNRDGKLQTAEVKILLRDVVDEIETKGRYSVYSTDVLREYDKNRDRVIDKTEVEGIIKHVR